MRRRTFASAPTQNIKSVMADQPQMNESVLAAALTERVRSLDQDYQDLRKSFGSLEARMESNHAAILSKIDTISTAFTTKLEARSITPWPTIWGGMSVAVAIMIALGSAFYMPIQRDIERQIIAVELQRVRSYDHNAQIATLQQALKDQEQRYTAISNRLAELIRTGK